MPEPDTTPGTRDDYLDVNERKLAVAALEMTAELLEAAEKNPDNWTWEIIALHNAVQGFMVLALQGTWSVTVEHRGQRTEKLKAQRERYRAIEAGDEAAASRATSRANEIMLAEGDLAAFRWLYERIKDPHGIMRRHVHSREFAPRAKDDQCMTCLNEIRNEIVHFMPKARYYLLTQFPALNETALHVIDFLLNESNAIDWIPGIGEDDLVPRAEAALSSARATLTRIQDDYKSLSLPASPLCGFVST